MNVQEIVNNRYGKGIAQCSNEEIYYALLEMTKSMAKEKESNEGKRKLYYISAEFLIGKLLSNNLINLGIYEEVKQVLAENGKNLAEIEEVEPEPSLGNGGLGRLAACFLDSIAVRHEEDRREVRQVLRPAAAGPRQGQRLYRGNDAGPEGREGLQPRAGCHRALQRAQ